MRGWFADDRGVARRLAANAAIAGISIAGAVLIVMVFRSPALTRDDSEPQPPTPEVSDDGVGGADPGAGSGLRGLEDRLAAVGGTLVVDSPPGAGTRVVVQEFHWAARLLSSGSGRLFDVPVSADQAVTIVGPSPF